MLSKIVGCILIFLGFLFLLYPETLRRSLRKKAAKKLRRYFFAAMLSLGILLISAGWRHEGILLTILMLAGIVAVFKGLLFLKSRATQEVTTYILERPVAHLKIFAAGQIALGLLIIFGLTR